MHGDESEGEPGLRVDLRVKDPGVVLCRTLTGPRFARLAVESGENVIGVKGDAVRSDPGSSTVHGTLEDRAVEVTGDVVVIDHDPGLVRGVRQSGREEVCSKMRVDQWVAASVEDESIAHPRGHDLEVGVREGSNGHELTILRRV